MWKFINTFVTILLTPIYIVFLLLFFIVWGLFTFTGIGPFFQYVYNRFDRAKLDRKEIITKNPKEFREIIVPAGINSCSNNKPYTIFAIFSEPEAPSKYPPVCIPNGLGANAVLIGRMQEELVKHGFQVLSFDRIGVGLSDVNESSYGPTAMDVVKELNYVMNQVMPSSTKWILLGPSMGSIVAQCYMSVFPDRIVGFLNMDGLPYPFFKFKNSFMWAAFIYRCYSSIIWTGVLRPFIGMALKANQETFGCKMFSIDIAIALVNQINFFSNLAKEMSTMMNCCEMAELAWGPQSIMRIPTNHLHTLITAPPTVSIEFDEKTKARKITSIRSESEVGESWASMIDVQNTIAYLRRENSPTSEIKISDKEISVTQQESSGESTVSSSPLLNPAGETNYSSYNSILKKVWGNLVVRVMSSRCHDFGNAIANSFYHQEMRDFSAAEHAKHALLALDGSRTNYPKITHTVMFSKTDDIVRYVQEIGDSILIHSQKNQE